MLFSAPLPLLLTLSARRLELASKPRQIVELDPHPAQPPSVPRLGANRLRVAICRRWQRYFEQLAV